jgi:SulP family sulfate permease
LGGLTAAIIALPLAIAFGVLAFSPLGPDFRSQGALAGLYGAIFAGFFASVFGGTPSQVTGPTGPMTVVMTTVFADKILADVEPTLMLPAAFMLVSLAGLLQMVLGGARLGTLIKFIPYPVVAGFMNGIAILIFKSQMGPMLGIAGEFNLHSVATGKTPISGWTLLTGLATVGIVMISPRITKILPGALMGLLLGTGVYYLAAIPAAGTMGPVIGHIPSGFPRPTYLPLFPQLFGFLPILLGPALVLAILGSLDSLLTSVVADAATRTRHHSNRELLGQGIGNFVAGCFGGIPGAGATVRTVVNIEAGGRTRLSGVSHSLVLLLIVSLMAPWAGKIPLVVLAGILMVTALRMIDQWSGNLAFKLLGTARQKREVAINLAVVALVTLITVVVDLMVAVAIGLLVATALFIAKMRGSVVGTVHYGDTLSSRRQRTPEETEVLERHGAFTAIVELHGPLFFGSADELAACVRSLQHVRRIIVDFRRVVEVDSSGARVLQLIQEEMEDSGRQLALCSIEREGPRWAFLDDLDILRSLGEDSIFPDLDHALEWAENQVLLQDPQRDPVTPLDIRETEIMTGLTLAEKDTILEFLECQEFAQGQALAHAGQLTNGFFLLTRGTVSARMDVSDTRTKRLASFGPGSVFGEMSVLERRPRTADVRADSDVTVYRMSTENLEQLCQDHPALACKLLWNLGRELSSRLRRAHSEILVLEGSPL